MGLIVVDRIDDVRVEGLVKGGDLVGLRVGWVVDFLASYYDQLLVVNLSVLDRAGVFHTLFGQTRVTPHFFWFGIKTCAGLDYRTSLA